MPNQMGSYLVTLSYYDLSVEFADRDRATAGAILSSFQPNQAVINQIAGQYAAPAIAAIHAIGQRAAAQMKAAEEANDIQHAGYWAQQHNNDIQHANWSNSQLNNTVQSSNLGDGQDTRAMNNQSFDNYILDQTVVQDNNMYNNGTIGHGTIWNSTADALVKADPDRFEYVTQPNFWEGTDYHR
jgi:hypothetical protein